LAKGRRIRLVDALVSQGWCATPEEARPWIMAGKVLVDEQLVDKVGAEIREGQVIRVKGMECRYVSRGGLKLEGALAAFQVDVSGRVALDCGASTGGFTDCLLQHGCSLVYAVDVGIGQLAGTLRNSPQVRNLERTNLSDVQPEKLQPLPDLVTLDLSFLSLCKAIPLVEPLVAEPTDLICLVKPLFETENMEARRTGIFDSDDEYVRVLQRICQTATQRGWAVAGVAPSPIRGSRGTVEFLLHLQKGYEFASTVGPRDDCLEAVVARALHG
jgi:23S rRNA (cytidine1920-2'-O)/16S rRNA (cytidine1409-2'-O)-methyltransferase